MNIFVSDDSTYGRCARGSEGKFALLDLLTAKRGASDGGGVTIAFSSGIDESLLPIPFMTAAKHYALESMYYSREILAQNVT